jgi:GNAT superfamily N-acetyltransferase
MRAQELGSGKLVIFDIDDTLVNTDTKVNVVRDGKVTKQLNSHDFTHYKLDPGESFDFGAFRDAREFFTKAKPIPGMIRQLKQDIATGNRVIMLTARSDFNDRDVFLDTFRRFGIDMDRVHVYRAGNMAIKAATEEKKKIILRHLLGKEHFDKLIMYDDSVPNLNAFLSLKKEYPRSRFYAIHVDPNGQAAEYDRTNEDAVMEIARIPVGDFGDKDNLIPMREPRNAQPLPGGSGLSYHVKNMTNKKQITVFDGGQLVAEMDLIDSIYPANAWEVEGIVVDPDYRGRALGLALYGLALSELKLTLKAGKTQTRHGRAMWLKLNQIPGVEIRGVTRSRRGQYQPRAGNEILAQNQQYVWYTFPVEAGSRSMRSGQRGVALYSYDTPSTMIAQWRGQ